MKLKTILLSFLSFIMIWLLFVMFVNKFNNDHEEIVEIVDESRAATKIATCLYVNISNRERDSLHDRFGGEFRDMEITVFNFSTELQRSEIKLLAAENMIKKNNYKCAE